MEGFDFVQNININNGIDDPVMSANITLISKMFHYNLCPDISNKINLTSSLLRLNARMKITTATVAEGQTPLDTDWQNVFEGYLTKISVLDNGKTIQLYCRDLGAAIQDVFIKTEDDFGADDGSLGCEDVIQDVLDANGLSSITLYTPTSPGFSIKKYIQQRQSVLDAIQQIALQPGYSCRYKFDTGTETWRLTLWEPDRNKTDIDFTFGPELYCTISNFEYDISSIRNMIKVVFTSLGASGTCTQTMNASQFSDNTKSWATNEFLGDQAVIVSGTGIGQERTITWNTSATCGIGTNWVTVPNTCSTYKIIPRRKEIEYPENGTCTSATTGQLNDTSKGWPAHFWETDHDLYIYSGLGAGYSYAISQSSWTKIIPATTWKVQPDATSKYAIVNNDDTGGGLYQYNARIMEITEAATSLIDTKAEARALARAIYNDLSRFFNAIEIVVDYCDFVELGDLYRFEANNIIFDDDIDLAVVGYTHSLGSDANGNQSNSTTLQLRGKPSGGYGIWFESEAKPGTSPVNRFPATVTGLALTTANEITATASYIKATWTLNTELDLSHYQLRYQRASSEWTYIEVPCLYNSVKIPMLKVSTSYDVQIRAVNKTAKASDWSASVNITTSA